MLILIKIMAQIHKKTNFQMKPNQAVYFVLQVGNNYTGLGYILVSITRPVAICVSQYIAVEPVKFCSVNA